MRLTSKLPNVGTTIFTQMSALAAETGAINLSQGFPGFPVSEDFKRILADTIHQNVHQYAPMQGLLTLREQIRQVVDQEYQRKIGAEDILITAGATQAIFTVVQALVNEGDEVLIIDPAYDCYRPAVDLVKAKAVHISLDNELRLDIDAIEDALNSRTRMIIVNNPHNPTGTVFPKSQMDSLVGVLEKYPDCFILADEVYEFINFLGEPVSFNYYPQLFDRLICISSFGKTLHATGWKVGYLTAPDKIMKEIMKVHQFLVFSVSHFAQSAIAEYLKIFDIKELAGFYRAKQEILSNSLSKSSLKLMPCSGTYFQVVDISGVTDMGDVDYAIWLTKEKGVATIPLSVFYTSQPFSSYLRLCFAKDEETLLKAGDILCQI